MIEEAARIAAQGFLYLLYGCALLGCIACAYGVLKLAWWNFRRSRFFKED